MLMICDDEVTTGPLKLENVVGVHGNSTYRTMPYLDAAMNLRGADSISNFFSSIEVESPQSSQQTPPSF